MSSELTKFFRGYIDEWHPPDEAIRDAINAYPNGSKYWHHQSVITHLWMERDRLIKKLNVNKH